MVADELKALRKACAVLQAQSLKNQRVKIKLLNKLFYSEQKAELAEEQLRLDLADRETLQRRLSEAGLRCEKMEYRETELEKKLVEQTRANKGLIKVNKRVESKLSEVTTERDLFKAEIQSLKQEHVQLGGFRNRLDKVREEKAQLQEEIARLQEEKDANRAELVGQIDDLRCRMESNAMNHPSDRRHRRSQPRFAGSQTMVAQEERYMSVLSLASDRITERHAPTPSLEHLA